MDVAEQYRVVHPGVGDPVAVAIQDTDDQSMAAEPAQVVAHPSRSDGAGEPGPTAARGGRAAGRGRGGR